MIHAGPDRIQNDIARHLEKIRLLLHQYCLVAPLEQVPDSAMATIAVLGIHPVELPHALGKVAIRRFNQQMIVIAHQAIRMNEPVEAARHTRQHVQEGDAVLVVFVNIFTAVTTRGDVIQGAGEFES